MSNEIKLTEDQKAAVDFPYDKPAVVTAAAGSGKTAILVERIIRLISDMKNPINAGSLAIMTFTVNATQNLRKRLNDKLQEKISSLSPEETIEKNYIAEQIINLRNASISTINSFCLNIIRENFQLFELPINFAIADETKKTAMEWSAVQLTMNDFYSDDDERGFSKKSREILFFIFDFESDRNLFDAVVDTAETLSSYGDAEKWLDEAANLYSSLDYIEEKYIRIYADFLTKSCKTIRKYFDEYANLIDAYKANLDEQILLESGEKQKKSTGKKLAPKELKSEKMEKVLDSMNETASFDKSRLEALEANLRNLLESVGKAGEGSPMDRLEALLLDVKKSSDYPAAFSTADNKNAIRARFTLCRKVIQDTFSEILKLDFSKEEEQATLNEQKIAAETFSRLVKKYIAYYTEIKRAQGCIDFADCELLLLEKLQRDEDFRIQLSQRYSCIIIDEFQDSNDVQAEIFKLLGKGNLFYVGDVKQSIYAFRGGNPMIMADLCKSKDGFCALPLNKNFRSRKQVIEVVNAAFSGLMTEEYGGVDYADKNALEYGADYVDDDNFSVDIYALDFKEDDEETDMQSARFTANLIKQMIEDEGFVISKRDGKEGRRPSFSDFMILTRNNKKIKLYREALRELDIPSVAPKGRNFLLSEEIELITNLLKIIDNPLRDEEMLKVLMSPIYRFSSEEIAELKLGSLGFPADKISGDDLNKISACTKKYSIYNCLIFCTKSLDEGNPFIESEAVRLANEAEKSLAERGITRIISSKAKAFLRDLEGLRYFMSNNSTENLLKKIYDVTDIFAVVGAYEDSRQRVSNLRRLETMVADFTEREVGTLGDFLRFIEKSIQNSRDIEEATAPEDAANSVKIMTFHGSKGLESPICILAELDKKMNIADYTSRFLINHEYYYAMDYVDRKNRFREKTFSGQALGIVNQKKAIGEEMRLLYVAMTRAEEKLIMIGNTGKTKIAELSKMSAVPEMLTSGIVPFYWVLKSLAKNLDVQEKTDCGTVKTSSSLPLRLFMTSAAPTVPQSLEEGEEEFSVTEEEVNELAALITKPYAHLAETSRQEKFSVTELAHRKSVIPFTLTKPAFDEAGNRRGSDVGNAYHHCMEHISYDVVKNSSGENLVDNIAFELHELCDKGKITEDELSCLKAEKIAAFFGSELGKQLLKSRYIEREFPFYAEIEGGEIDDDLSGKVGIQGRIDLLFEDENGGIVVVDYKTDSDIEEEKSAYSQQVKIYAAILPMLLGKRVSRTCLYLFTNGDTVEL